MPAFAPLFEFSGHCAAAGFFIPVPMDAAYQTKWHGKTTGRVVLYTTLPPLRGPHGRPACFSVAMRGKADMLDVVNRSKLTQCMVRPCVAREFRRVGGERSCINVSGLSLEHLTPGHHGYQRACDLIMRQASTGPVGSPVSACAGKTEPPSRFILSQTSAGGSYRFDYVIAGSSSRAVAVIVGVE